MIGLTLREYLRGRVSGAAAIFWSLIWAGLLLTGLFPEAYEFVVALLGLALPINFITTFSIIFLFILAHQLYRRTSEVNRRLTKLTQEIVLLRRRVEERLG